MGKLIKRFQIQKFLIFRFYSEELFNTERILRNLINKGAKIGSNYYIIIWIEMFEEALYLNRNGITLPQQYV